MYRDFEDLRDNCPAEIKADIAIDFQHPDPDRLAEMWPVTADGEFRLYLVQSVSDFWEEAVRARGKIPEDGFAIEILLDSYADPDMGHSLFLELHAYCGTEAIGELCWSVFDDAALEKKFMHESAERAVQLVQEQTAVAGLTCEAEITEVVEL